MRNNLTVDIFNIKDEATFNDAALKIYHLHAEHNPVYKKYLSLIRENNVEHYSQIPFLPIEFFKKHRVLLDNVAEVDFFESSGTTGIESSRHYIADFSLYEKSLLKAFSLFLGNPQDFAIVALLPHYLERSHSSLVYMVKTLMAASGHLQNNFFLYNHKQLYDTLIQLESQKQKTLLIGVSFALVDFAEEFFPPAQQPLQLKHTFIMETGGMKGRKKELTRSELHTALQTAFGVKHIYSEYGMAELFSQAYLLDDGKFHCPPWMKIVLRSTYNPFEIVSEFEKTGGINVIDLANLYSCPFVQTQDLGKIYANSSFDVLGRFDSSDVRGCNLLYV